MNKKILLPGFISGMAILVIGMMALSRIWNVIFPSLEQEYKQGIFRPWSDPIMWLFYLYPFVLGLVLAWGWEKTKGLIRGKNIYKRGLVFGLCYWLAASLPGMLMSLSSFRVSVVMVFSWSLGGLIQAVITGWILAKINP
jgi:hypothetical protein